MLTEAIIDAHARRSSVEGNHLFDKATCPHCVRAKGYLKQASIDYEYHDVVKDCRSACVFGTDQRANPLTSLESEGQSSAPTNKPPLLPLELEFYANSRHDRSIT